MTGIFLGGPPLPSAGIKYGGVSPPELDEVSEESDDHGFSSRVGRGISRPTGSFFLTGFFVSNIDKSSFFTGSSNLLRPQPGLAGGPSPTAGAVKAADRFVTTTSGTYSTTLIVGPW